MSRLFYGQREQSLTSDLTKELIRDVIGQKIYYYAISEQNNRNHELYNESTNKVWDAPIELPALVGSPERNVKTDIFGPEALSKLEVFLHYRDMLDIGININVGDFVGYGDIYYEISDVTRLRNIAGMVETLDGYKLTCVQARKGQIDPPQLGPSDQAYSDPGAVQKEFAQTRGASVVKGVPTGDKRDLQKEGVLEAPVSGAEKVVREDEKTGSDFYGDKW